MSVEGKVRALQPGEHLALLVRATAAPADTQPWVVQTSPHNGLDGTWASMSVFMGFLDDPPGTPVRLCVLIATEPLSRGQYWTALPAASASYCVDVRRR
jgi:hypothetical protein